MAAHSHRALLWIAVFKLAKATALLLAAAWALRLLKPGELDELVEHLTRLPLAAGWRPVVKLVNWISELSPHNLKLVAAVATAYAGLYATEGIGLWLRKRWAEYLTTVMTASLIPFEIWELVRGPTPLKIAALIVNIAIVIYLIYVLRSDRARGTA